MRPYLLLFGWGFVFGRGFLLGQGLLLGRCLLFHYGRVIVITVHELTAALDNLLDRGIGFLDPILCLERAFDRPGVGTKEPFKTQTRAETCLKNVLLWVTI